MTQLNFLEPVEDQIRDPSGNRKLVKYGIQDEQSDFRAHVCYRVQRVYVYPTDEGQRLVSQAEDLGLQSKSVWTGDIETARGYPVPISYFKRIHEILIPLDVMNDHKIDKFMPTSTKGTIATSIVLMLLKRDMIPLPVRPNLEDSRSLQISGTDITINASLRLQVKCDLPGGDRKHGGSGNLFIQEAECNPYRRH